jgi:hypothetical protein
MFILLLIATIYIYNYLNRNNNGSGGISTPPPNINDLPESTLLLVNNTGNDLNVFLQEVNNTTWDFLTKNNCGKTGYKFGSSESSDAIGALSGVIVTIPKNNDPNKDNFWCTLKIPDTNGVAMRLSPIVIVNVNGTRTMLSKYFQGQPSLIEFGKDMVGNMSIEDGTTYNMSQTMSIDKDTYTTINYRGNPCTYNQTDVNNQPIPTEGSYPFQNYFLPGTNSQNLFGCLVGNPYGTFIDGTNADSSPYYHLTRNLNNGRKKWCDEVQKGQCNRDQNNDDEYCQTSKTPPYSDFNATTCTGCFENGKQTKFTTYCYDFNDTSSQPYFKSPYKMQVLFKNLADPHLEELTIPSCKGTPYDGKCGGPDVYCLSKKIGVPDCPKYLNVGNLDIINVCYQNGGPTPPILNCTQNYDCPTGNYYCPTNKLCSKNKIDNCPEICISIGPTGPTGPTGSTGTIFPTKQCPPSTDPITNVCQTCATGNNPCPKDGNSYYVGTFANGSVGCREEGDASYQGPFPPGSVTSQCFFNCQNFGNCTP